MHVKDKNFAGLTKMQRIKRTEELNDDESDEFYCSKKKKIITWNIMIVVKTVTEKLEFPQSEVKFKDPMRFLQTC